MGVGGIEKGNMGGYDGYRKGGWGRGTWRREAEVRMKKGNIGILKVVR